MRAHKCTPISSVKLRPTTLGISWQMCFESWQLSLPTPRATRARPSTHTLSLVTGPDHTSTARSTARPSVNSNWLFNCRMTNMKCVVYFENEYSGSTIVEAVMVVKDSHTRLKCLKYTDTHHEEACSHYHHNADVGSTVLETIPATNVPYMYCQGCAARSRNLNNYRETCNNSKTTLQLITGLDDLCCCNMNVCCATVNKLPMDVSLAGCVSSAMCQSPRFCKGFLKYAKFHGTKISLNSYTATHDRATTIVPFLLKVRLVHKMPEWIDFKWCDRMQCLVTKRMMLGDALNWLSTLGGAYSALGDYYQHHAVQAGEISMRQMRLAMEVGDQPTVIRCHLYFGLSLMQRGQLWLSRNIIRHQYKLATLLPVTDSQLLDVCQGLWTKLRDRKSVV